MPSSSSKTALSSENFRKGSFWKTASKPKKRSSGSGHWKPREEKRTLRQKAKGRRPPLRFKNTSRAGAGRRDGQNKRLLENELAILELERKAAETEALSEQKRNSLGAEYRKEAAKYDQAKTAVRATLGDALSANAKETADLLVNHLQAYVKLFKKIMLSLLQEIEEESRAAHGRFQEYLWIARRGCRRSRLPSMFSMSLRDLLRKTSGRGSRYMKTHPLFSAER